MSEFKTGHYSFNFRHKGRMNFGESTRKTYYLNDIFILLINSEGEFVFELT
jgi:hypothetical protein